MNLIKQILLIPLKKSLKHIMVGLGMYPSADFEAILNQVNKDQKQKNFLDDIKRIRNAGDYFPDYNAGLKFLEYNIEGTKTGVKTSAEPKEKCNTMEDWNQSIRNEAKKLNSAQMKPIQLIILFPN